MLSQQGAALKRPNIQRFAEKLLSVSAAQHRPIAGRYSAPRARFQVLASGARRAGRGGSGALCQTLAICFNVNVDC